MHYYDQLSKILVLERNTIALQDHETDSIVLNKKKLI